MDWSSFIIAVFSALAGGGVLSLFTIREQRKGMKIENKMKEDDRWNKFTNELEEMVGVLNERLEKKDLRIRELDSENSRLRERLNEISTDRAVCKILRCDVMECPNRRPPMGFTKFSVEDAINNPDV